MGLLVALALIAATTTVIVFLIRYFELRRRLQKLPQPRSYPLIGHAMITRPDPEGFLNQLLGMGSVYKNPKMCLLWAGFKPVLMIYSAELFEKVVASSRHLDKGFVYALLEPWLGLSLLTSSGERWRPMRKLLTPTFHYDILKDFVPIFNEHARVLVQKLMDVKPSEPVEVLSTVTLCTLDIICETSMGKNINAQVEKDSDYVRAVHEINDIVIRRTKNPLMWNSFMFRWFGEGKQHDQYISQLQSFTRKVVDDRKQELEASDWRLDGRPAFLDLLLEMAHNGQLDFNDIQQEVDTFMFEGHDTTSAGLSWAIHLIGNHPEVQAKIQAELLEVMGSRTEVTSEDISKLKYLECCIKESLRVYPSVPMIARELGCDEEFGDVVVPKGTLILLNQYIIHHDPDQWDNPEVFDPDRFFVDDGIKRHSFAFVPFSAGGRNCIGQRFALMEEKVILAWIFRNFTVTSVEKLHEMRKAADLILRPLDGIHMTLQRRRASTSDF